MIVNVSGKLQSTYKNLANFLKFMTPALDFKNDEIAMYNYFSENFSPGHRLLGNIVYMDVGYYDRTIGAKNSCNLTYEDDGCISYNVTYDCTVNTPTDIIDCMIQRELYNDEQEKTVQLQRIRCVDVEHAKVVVAWLNSTVLFSLNAVIYGKDVLFDSSDLDKYQIQNLHSSSTGISGYYCDIQHNSTYFSKEEITFFNKSRTNK